MYYVIGWHVDIDVLCIMFTWRHTRVMQYIYMKTYMSYVSHQSFQFERFEVWKSLGLGPGPLAWAQDMVYTWSIYTCGEHFQTLSFPIIYAYITYWCAKHCRRPLKTKTYNPRTLEDIWRMEEKFSASALAWLAALGSQITSKNDPNGSRNR